MKTVSESFCLCRKLNVKLNYRISFSATFRVTVQCCINMSFPCLVFLLVFAFYGLYYMTTLSNEGSYSSWENGQGPVWRLHSILLWKLHFHIRYQLSSIYIFFFKQKVFTGEIQDSNQD